MVHSHHHGNTRKITEAMAGVLGADIVSAAEATLEMPGRYDLVGFGSGIYFGRFAADVRTFLQQLPHAPTRPRAFVFSTSGLACLSSLWHLEPKRLLRRRGFDIVGEFSCRGFDTVGPLWLIGGLNRRHPDAADLARAEQFARALCDRPPAGADAIANGS